MEQNFNVQLGKMRSLMERMNGNMTAYEGMLNEEKLINEAVKTNRVQVTRDEIIKLLDDADNIQNKKHNGLFASITYVKPAEILKTKLKVNTEKLSGALDKYKDRSEEDWHKKLSSFKDAQKSNTPNPISYIITVTRYNIRWHSEKDYDIAAAKYTSGLHDLRMKHGMAIQSDGTLGDNHNQRQKTDATGALKFNQTGNPARNVNMINKVGQKSTAYIVDETGHIVSEIPNDVMWSIHGKVSTRGGVEAEVKKTLSGEALEAYAKSKAELDAQFDPRNLLYDRTLSICCSVNGVSYYYINDALIANIAKKSEVNVNQSEMVEIAKEQLGESFDEIQGFAN
jgi:hypothetical protein